MHSSAIGTLVERCSRFTMLLHLPRKEGYLRGEGIKNGPPLAGPAYALNNRTWVSGSGTDAAGCGPIATPCRSLQHAHDQTNVGGEIDVKDSAGYGSVVINKAITILDDGSIAGVLAAANASAITVSAGATDDVFLKGLTIEGAGGVRIHDLRHTFASIGAVASLGLPIVGKLLGHSQPATTARHAHLDADPLRRATDLIGSKISEALER